MCSVALANPWPQLLRIIRRVISLPRSELQRNKNIVTFRKPTLALIRCHQGLITNPKVHQNDITWLNSLKTRYLHIHHHAEYLKVIALLVSEVRCQCFGMSQSLVINIMISISTKFNISNIKKYLVLTSDRYFPSCWSLQLHWNCSSCFCSHYELTQKEDILYVPSYLPAQHFFCLPREDRVAAYSTSYCCVQK